MKNLRKVVGRDGKHYYYNKDNRRVRGPENPANSNTHRVSRPTGESDFWTKVANGFNKVLKPASK